MGTTEAAAEWTAVADAWDLATDYVDEHSVAATEAFIAAADVRVGDRVLELAAGPGTLGPRWAALAGPTGRVVLSDIAPGMVEVARRRNPDLEVAVIDASAIDASDASFDVVVSRMGLMFVPDPAVALGETHRVLTAGGRLAALTWAGMEHNPWMTCVGMAAMMNGVVAGPLPIEPGGIFSLGDPDQLRSLVADAGFTAVEVTGIDFSFAVESVDAHVDRVSALAGPLAAAFAAASDDQLAAVRRTASELAADHLRDGVLPGRALLVSGRR
jgi:SAM-dependent methyltransferase